MCSRTDLNVYVLKYLELNLYVLKYLELNLYVLELSSECSEKGLWSNLSVWNVPNRKYEQYQCLECSEKGIRVIWVFGVFWKENTVFRLFRKGNTVFRMSWKGYTGDLNVQNSLDLEYKWFECLDYYKKNIRLIFRVGGPNDSHDCLQSCFKVRVSAQC
jgi:hypothetical protein